MPDEFNHLSKEDLYLLMESYRNMIQMHSTLAEQHKTIIDLQNEIISKQEKISLKQVSSSDQLTRVTDKLEECSANLIKTNENVQASSSKIDKSISTEIGYVRDKMGRHQVDLTKQNASVINRIYISIGLMATIIIGLIGIMIGLLDKYNLLSEVHELVHRIAEYLIK
jgi:uncharacterized coiled-coil protein SlyX